MPLINDSNTAKSGNVTSSSPRQLGEIAALLGLQLQGDPGTAITGLAALANAGPGRLSFCNGSRYLAELRATQASAVIVRPEDAEHCPTACLLAGNPYLAFARASQLFAPAPDHAPGIHPTAHVDAGAQLGEGVSVGPGASIGPDCVIGTGSRIGPGCVVGAGCRIGNNCTLHANVTLYHGVLLGDRVSIHASTVIGADGFGYARGPEGYEKIAQLGTVRIGDDVEIGAATTIDRGALDDTVIGKGVKIDNLVQIAHNVVVGDHTIICGCCGLAGSSVIGKNCIIAGGVGVADHIHICDGVTVTGGTVVNQSIREPGTWSSGSGLDKTATWKKNIVRFRQLDDFAKRLEKLEKLLDTKGLP